MRMCVNVIKHVIVWKVCMNSFMCEDMYESKCMYLKSVSIVSELMHVLMCHVMHY